MAGDPCRAARRDVGDAAPRAGLWRACRRHGARRAAGFRRNAARPIPLCRADLRADRLGAARGGMRGDLRHRVSRIEAAALFLAAVRAGLVIAAIGLFGTPELVRQAYLPLGPPTVFLSLVLICVLVGRAAVLRGDGVATLFGSAGTIVFAFLVHDVLAPVRPRSADPGVAPVLFGAAGGDRHRADLALRQGAERGRRLRRPPGDPRPGRPRTGCGPASPSRSSRRARRRSPANAPA